MTEFEFVHPKVHPDLLKDILRQDYNIMILLGLGRFKPFQAGLDIEL